MGNVVQLVRDVKQAEREDLFNMLDYINEIIGRGYELRELIEKAPLGVKSLLQGDESAPPYYSLQEFAEELTKFLQDMPF